MTHFLDATVEPALWFGVEWSLRWALLIGLAALLLLLLRPVARPHDNWCV